MPSNINAEKVQEAFEEFMELYEEQGDLARIKHDNLANTVSEGIAYGMLIMVYMDNEKNKTQEKFDKLWNYYNKFLNNNGLMNWRISGFSGPDMMGMGAATDAELDAAVALLQAYKQWGNEKYFEDAKTLIGKIAKHEVNANGYLKPGDSWDNKKNPSYFSTAALQLFKHASDFDWDKVITNSYSLTKKSQNATTGLVPDWCSEQGTPVDGDVYKYDATRTPWRLAWAYSWYGHPEAKEICTKIASWITSNTSNDPSKIVDGYRLDGSKTGQWNNATFVGPFACAGMVDEAHQAWVDKSTTHLSSLKETVYYQISLKIITLLYLSGNFPDFWTETSVSRPKNAATPSTFSISVNSNISTNRELDFLIATPGHAEITLYTITGQRAAVVANCFFSAGNHRVTLNPSLTGGTYIIKMRQNGNELNSRITILR